MLSIEELEARLKPREPNFREGEWSDHSAGGFLAPHESLMGVLRADYDALSSLGRTYEEMAQIADGVLKQGINKRYKGTNTIDRDRFEWMPIGSGGVQTCPWGCRGIDGYGYYTSSSGHVYAMEKGKGDSDLMERLFKGERDIVKFGGMDRILYLSAFTVITGLTPHLIASHYFFEGDSSFRTDPRKLLQVVGLINL